MEQIREPKGKKLNFADFGTMQSWVNSFLKEDILFVNWAGKYIIIKEEAKYGSEIYVSARNPYLCEECFCRKNMYSREKLAVAVAERRCPKWEVAQNGHKPVCGACGKEGTVYG